VALQVSSMSVDVRCTAARGGRRSMRQDQTQNLLKIFSTKINQYREPEDIITGVVGLQRE
jgi:hypothetical protein